MAVDIPVTPSFPVQCSGQPPVGQLVFTRDIDVRGMKIGPDDVITIDLERDGDFNYSGAELDSNGAPYEGIAVQAISQSSPGTVRPLVAWTGIAGTPHVCVDPANRQRLDNFPLDASIFADSIDPDGFAHLRFVVGNSVDDVGHLAATLHIQGNEPPTVSAIEDQVAWTGSPFQLLEFTVGDAESPVAELTVDVTSDNPDLFGAGGLQLSGAGSIRTLQMTPREGRYGTANVVVSVSDGEDTVTESFRATVLPGQCIGPDAFGYVACPTPFEPTDLWIGQPGVTTVLDGVDDRAVAIPLGANTVNVYGTTYTGDAVLFASSNGLLTFETGNAAYSNNALNSTPTQVALAPYWDDLLTNTSPADAVLSRIDDVDGDGTADVLNIVWSDVRRFAGSPSPMTFHAAISLNTGNSPGDIIFGFDDVDSGDAARNGASATVGLKAAGAQGGNRLLVTANAPSELVGTGRAIRISRPSTPVPEVNVSLAPVAIGEDSAASVDLVFTRRGDDNDDLSIEFHLAGTAQYDSDYQIGGGATRVGDEVVVTIPRGQSAVHVPLTPIADSVVEGNETVHVELQPTDFYRIGQHDSALATIVDDDARISIESVVDQVMENDGDALQFRVRREGDLSRNLTVRLAASGTATSDDFVFGGVTGQSPALAVLELAAWQEEATIWAMPIADSTPERHETVELAVQPAAGIEVGLASQAVGTIENDDIAYRLVAAPTEVVEDSGAAVRFTIAREGEASGDQKIHLRVDGSATRDADYVTEGLDASATGEVTLAFPEELSSVDLLFRPLADTIVEGNETMDVTILADDAYVVVGPATVVGTIRDDEAPQVSVAVTPAEVREDAGAALLYSFTRTGSPTVDLIVDFGVAGSASSVTDYTVIGATSFSGTSGSVVIPAGQATATVQFRPRPDTMVESDETLQLTVTPKPEYTVGVNASAQGVIRNDDTLVTISVSPSSVLEDGAANLVYTFLRTGVLEGDLTVNFAVGGGATLNVDYAAMGALSFGASSGSVVIRNGQPTAQVTIDPTPETSYEANEDVQLTLTSGAGYFVGGSGTATGTIQNDDAATCLGPSAFGYRACASPYEEIDLRMGDAGVFSILDGADDTSVGFNLGTNVFRFFGVNYTGANALYVTTNGMITFGTGITSPANTDLVASPTVGLIAAAWDDWQTQLSTADRVLGKYVDANGDGTNERLIIEWSETQHYGSTGSGVTFQAILGINTGANSGDIYFNYPDLATEDGYSQGVQATVGIRDAGTTADRLLVSYNAASPYVGTGRAIKLSASLAAPSVIMLEAEAGAGSGNIMQRSNASGQRSVLMGSGATRTLTFDLPAAGRYQLYVGYSNDGPSDTVTVRVDGTNMGSFLTQNTRPSGGVAGSGWNEFRRSTAIATGQLAAGRHEITLSTNTDYYGVEIDYVRLELIA